LKFPMAVHVFCAAGEDTRAPFKGGCRPDFVVLGLPLDSSARSANAAISSNRLCFPAMPEEEQATQAEQP
jgi:hypothetical protein